MVDEDFVMGYVTGYNDGVQSGGGGGKFDNIPLLKKYSFAGTDYGIGVVDVNNEMFQVANNVQNSGAYVPDKVNFCPYPNSLYSRIRLAVLKGGEVVGLLMMGDYLSINRGYSFDGTTWNKVGTDTTEKIENALLSVEENTYNNGARIRETLVFSYNKCTYSGDVLNRTSSYTEELVYKEQSSSPSGVSLNSSQYIMRILSDCSDISNEHFRGFLSAWADCTGLEEVF